ncbi:tetratricopeptide repeat protein [Akkermansiaceae bacterium]|nr:tetratricopeptide repeat protein [Akkermansiaceae bacterium]
MSVTEKNLKLFEDAIQLFANERIEESKSLLTEIEASALPLAKQADYHGLMGDLYAQKGEVGKAFESLGRAIAVDTEDPMSYLSRAHLYRSEGKATEYSEDMETAIRLSKLPKNKEKYDPVYRGMGLESYQAYLEANYMPLPKGSDNLRQVMDSIPPDVLDPEKIDLMDPSEREEAEERLLAAALRLDADHTETGAKMPEDPKTVSASSTTSGSNGGETPKPTTQNGGCLNVILVVGSVLTGLKIVGDFFLN